jgi:hypothetical protein
MTHRIGTRAEPRGFALPEQARTISMIVLLALVLMGTGLFALTSLGASPAPCAQGACAVRIVRPVAGVGTAPSLSAGVNLETAIRVGTGFDRMPAGWGAVA